DLAQVPKETAKQATMPRVRFDRRVLIAPAVSRGVATEHDASRRKKHSSDLDFNVRRCEPRLRDQEAPEDENEERHQELVPTPEGSEGRQISSLIDVYSRPF